MDLIKKVIVVGLGNISLRHRRNLKLLFPDVYIISIPASGIFNGQNIDFSDQLSLSIEDAIQDKIDMAIVASPATFHLNHAKLLMRQGIPTLIEKPVTSNTLDANELINTYKDTLTPVSVSYCLRYMPATIKMKNILDKGIIGNVYNANVEVGQYLPDWRPSKNYLDSVSVKRKLGGGVLLELSHEIDYIQWFFGDMDIHYSQLRNSSELDLEVEEIADVVLVSNSGLVCNMHLDFLQKKIKRVCSFVGEKGRLEWDLIENEIKLVTKSDNIVLFSEKEWDNNEMYISLLKDFINLIKGNKNNCIDLQAAYKTVFLVEEINNQAVRGIKQ